MRNRYTSDPVSADLRGRIFSNIYGLCAETVDGEPVNVIEQPSGRYVAEIKSWALSACCRT